MPKSKPNPNNEFLVYRGDGKIPDRKPDEPRKELPPAPPWRIFKDDPDGAAEQQLLKGEHFKPPEVAIDMVNAALTLRRPLLITGNPGTGKSTLAYAVARELGLGSVLKWPITTKITLKDGLYSYDAIARLQDAQAQNTPKDPKDIGNYITLGPLGTAFLPTDLPRVLLIDEIDKSEIDLPNDLLNLFEDGEFSISELQRLKLGDTAISIRTTDREKNGTQKEVKVKHGVVRCRAFPLVIMTSNGERDFPSAFLRRCLRFKMPTPKKEFLEDIVRKHLGQTALEKSTDLVTAFCKKVEEEGQTLATDQLLNAIHWRTQEQTDSPKELTEVAERITTQKPTSEKAEPEPKLISVENHLLKDLNSPDEE